jgi:hypothetical protein
MLSKTAISFNDVWPSTRSQIATAEGFNTQADRHPSTNTSSPATSTGSTWLD